MTPDKTIIVDTWQGIELKPDYSHDAIHPTPEVFDKFVKLNSRSRSLPMVERLRKVGGNLCLFPALYFAGMAFAYGVMKLIEWIIL